MVDVTVRGAGIFGLSIAWVCTQRGARVTVIDPEGPGAGSSGGLVGALAPHVPENWNVKKAFQLRSLLRAPAFWGDVAAAGGRDPGYHRGGRLQPILSAHALDLAKARADSAKDLWAGHAVWQVEPANATGWEPPSPTGWIIRDTLSAHLHPRLACAALVAALEARGVQICRDAEDQGRVVWATGVAGLAALSEQHQRAVGTGVKGQAALLDHDASGAPQIFADGVHIIPHQDGTVAVGSTSERDFDDPHTTDAQLDAVIDKARAAVPALQDAAVLDRWAGVRPRARSRAPMLGVWPDRPGHYIANGGFKIGFGMAPEVAEVMADLVLDGRDSIPEGFAIATSL
ncbi:oxidoreductase [Roseobacter cerasinus]|uniref:Oxidoreductase n=1 Tax=Roseobacter cerasinus TaxID=2602289 RepID=A0A640VME2_9RHOB|nr:FAD-binding oxidoreductase [Roseobacter cerasinus]GFE48947.1 oxidoreductase [Roseobacter cerasinus]